MESNDVLEDASPPSGLPSSRPRRGMGMFFQGPTEEETPAPAPRSSPEADSLPPLLDEDGSASGTGWPSDEPDDLDESGEGTSSPGSTRAGSPLKLASKAALRATIAKGVLIGTDTVNRLATQPGSLEALNGLYKADEEDADRIADPAASILSRRGGGIAGKVSPDTADALQMLMGLAGYAGKQFALATAIRQHQEAQAQVQVVPESAV